MQDESVKDTEKDGEGAYDTFPIFVLTADALQGDRERCLEASIGDYLSKPFNQAQLQDVF